MVERASGRVHVHKVGVLAAALGLAGLAALPFAIVRANRIATGAGRSLFASTGAPLAALLVGGWLLVLALSLVPLRGAAAGWPPGWPTSAIATGCVSAPTPTPMPHNSGDSANERAWACRAKTICVFPDCKKQETSNQVPILFNRQPSLDCDLGESERG